MRSAVSGRLIAGRYRLGSVVGHGGMGVVWQSRDELLSRDVAVKELTWPPDYTEQEQRTACRRTIREAQTAAKLNHPNIIRVYDIVEEDGHPWIVMELLPYRSLRDLVREDGPLTPVRAARVGLGILAALRAAHAEGIVHRDVTPANVLVGPDERAVLTDFGIARAAGSPTLTNVGTLVGSPSYIAPERARGKPSGAPGDLWGLGASLYAAVEGHPPFERPHALATLTAIVADEPELASHAGPLWPLISALLHKEPEARPDEGETEQMLRDVARGETTHVMSGEPRIPVPVVPAPPAPDAPSAPVEPPAPPREPGSSRSWGSRAGLVAGALLAALAAAGVIVTLVLTSSGSPGHQSTASSPAGGLTASARPSVSSSASAHATPAHSTSPGGGTAPSGTSRPPASPSGQPSVGQGGQNSGGSGVPAGFYWFTNSTGFSIGVPNGWTISHQGHYVYVQDPANSQIYLLIDQSGQPKSDPLADWKQQEANRASGYADYHRIRLESVSYPQAEKAADWEFTYNQGGVTVHILNRNILANAHHAYALYWSVPESEWSAYYHYFQTFADTFRPAS